MFTQHSGEVVSCFRERIYTQLRPIVPDAVKHRGKENSEKTSMPGCAIGTRSEFD